MKYLHHFLCAGLVLLLFTALSPLRADEIEVFAASSLSDALKEISASYETESGDKILLNFAASDTLATQIQAGASADIFFSADEAKMNYLEFKGLIVKETRKDLLSNGLAIVVPAKSCLALTSATQLGDSKIQKIALGQPLSVPAGIYARIYLEKIGVWDKIKLRVVPFESVRATLTDVETGKVDAGIVYKTDALISKKVKVAYEVPVAEGPVIAYPVALVKTSQHAAAAQKFLDYLATDSSLKVFEKYGFIVKLTTH